MDRILIDYRKYSEKGKDNAKGGTLRLKSKEDLEFLFEILWRVSMINNKIDLKKIERALNNML